LSLAEDKRFGKLSLVDYGLALLNHVAARNNLTVSNEARTYLRKRLDEEFTHQPYDLIFEKKDKSGTRRFGEGVETLPELVSENRR
jgi:hypothetical protein